MIHDCLIYSSKTQHKSKTPFSHRVWLAINHMFIMDRVHQKIVTLCAQESRQKKRLMGDDGVFTMVSPIQNP